ncbi:DTW domain-containing protein 1 [Perkinsus chesapeaki]|uniref:tRNA-uridine aminocarboxypropyltransferase 1 n=1 Tax=Perkinsus chesapeaki TaxID=330153 RepID=A0A7J6L488_PERCH|nr:DTW domain-containing protein 1 [Perkinsus chesapeaki]
MAGSELPPIDLKSLHLDSFQALESEECRKNCPQCGRRRKFYCYECALPLNGWRGVPYVKPPFDIHLVRHPTEKASKSSVIPLQLICNPDRDEGKDTSEIPRAYLHSATEDFNPNFDPESTVLLYPGEDSQSIDEVEWSKIKRVAVIDCTWHQTGYMLKEEWDAVEEKPYDGRYDNMLWYFVYMHRLVAEAHKRRGTKRDGRVCKDDGGPEGKRKVLNRGIPERMLNCEE